MKKLLLLISGAAFLVATSCTTRLVDFTLISTKNVTKADIAKSKNVGRKIGEDKKRAFILPLATPNAKEAVDKAIESVPGGIALQNGVLTYKWFYIPYIYGEFSYVAEGDVLKK